MASRLSEEALRAVYDGGHQGLTLASPPLPLIPVEATVDLDALLTAADPIAAVQAVEPQPLYRAMVLRGLEDCLEVLPLLSQEQLTRIFDYDCWSDDRLVPADVAKWLSLYREVGNEELHKRFKELDEEYQLAFLCPLIQIYDEEEFEKLPLEEQDAASVLPCNQLHYRIMSDDARVVEAVQALIEASLSCDVAYAYSMLQHAQAMPPNEQEQLVGQFRRSRIEEDGFVTYEESLTVFRSIDLDALAKRYHVASRQGASALQGAGEPAKAVLAAKAQGRSKGAGFLKDVIERAGGRIGREEYDRLAHAYAYLGNMLAAASRLETDDLTGQRRVLGQAQGLAGLGLEWLAQGDVDAAVTIMLAEHPQTLFRCGMALVGRLAEAMAARLVAHRVPGCEEVERYLRLDKRGGLLMTLDTRILPVLGLLRTETLKGVFNRYPLRPVEVPGAAGEAGSSSYTPTRVQFAALSSLEDLRDLAARLDAISGMLELAGLACTAGGDGSSGVSSNMDALIATALSRALLGQGFSAKPLNAAELDQLIELDAPSARARLSDFYSQMESHLREQVAVFAVSARLPADIGAVRDPLQAVMAEFSDAVMAVMAAKEQARAVGSAAFTGLIVRCEEAR